MPPGLHGELARTAERQGTSLNGYIIARLTESVDWSADDQGPEPAARTGRDVQLVTWLLLANVVAVALAGAAAIVILVVAGL
jgi:HicB family